MKGFYFTECSQLRIYMDEKSGREVLGLDDQFWNLSYQNPVNLRTQYNRSMLVLSAEVEQYLPNYPTLLLIAAITVLYLIYYLLMRYCTVKMEGNYDRSKKNIGKTLPPYPNGWYIACKSKELKTNQTKSIEIAGHNIVLFRNPEGKIFALYAYCSHMGANLGIGGQVVNESCIQCPFHGWLFDGQTGQCVDHDKKPIMAKTIEYDTGFADKEHRNAPWKDRAESPKLRKYHTKELNTFVYVWIHSNPTVEPYFQMINGQKFCKNYKNRGQTIHDIYCHLQDIPENGADVFHFKYIHRYLIGRYKAMEVSWKPKWKRGDDPDLPELFQHESKNIRAFKQKIYNDLIKPLPNKQYYSFANVDNYVHLPFLGPTFFFNLTIVQMGPGIVNVFLKTHFFEVVFFQYIQPQGKFHQRLFHEMFASSWLPYWICYIMLYAEGMQVYYDMLVWDAKRFGYRLFLKDNEADRYIKSWREWFSQNYEGCEVQLQPSSTDW